MRKLSLTFVLMLSLSFFGCSRVHKITYLSDPPGAIISCDGKRIGYAPITVSYKLKDSQKELELSACTAKWVSGAKSQVKERVLPIGNRINSKSNYLFQRPEHPDYEKDETFALEQKKVRSMERANEAAIQAQEADYNGGYYDDGYYGGGGCYGEGHYGGNFSGRGAARMTVHH